MFCSRCGTDVNPEAKFCPSCGLDLAGAPPTPEEPTPEVAEIELVRDALKQEYDVLEELGRGGMAIVYRARETQLERTVAIKVLPFSLAFDSEFVERFQREARTAAQLEHPHIIPIYRVGRAGRVIYFVMKYLRGGALSQLLAERGRLPPDEIVTLLIQAVGALGAAHRRDIVHRDIKPDNIMFDEGGHAVVTDFGIAKAATGTRLTGTGMSIGTPHYMSPEQARAQPLDGRSDIYSLGVVAYQCLTGTVPFDGEDSFAIGYKHIMEELPAPPLATAEDRRLFGIIQRMLAKQPEERFQSAEELADELKSRAASFQPSASPDEIPTTAIPAIGARPTDGASPTTPTTPIPRATAGAPPRRKRSGVLVGLLTIVLLGGGGAGGYWYFALGATWPPPLERIPLLSGLLDDSVGTAAVDSMLAAGDSLLASLGDPEPDSDSVGVGDTAGVAEPADTGGAVAVADLPNIGWILVAGVPRRGQVTVDGEARSGSVYQVAPGSRRVEVQAVGYEPFVETVAVARGDTVEIAVALVRLAAEEAPEATPVAEPPPVVDVCAVPPPDYNADGSCYDVAPAPTVPPILTLPDGITGPVDPVLLWVKVSTDGKAIEVERLRQSRAAFTIAAMRFARRITYTPGRKDGRPVEAWLRMRVVARSQ